MAKSIEQCAALVQSSSGLLVTAGAGMGVDSGLPDFRGNKGFWQAYPALRKAHMSFKDVANPQAFAQHPRLRGDFMATGFSFIGAASLMQVSKSFVKSAPN